MTTAGLVAVLDQVLAELSRTDTDVSWSGFDSPDEARRVIGAHRDRLASGDRSRLASLTLLFAPTGPLQELAISSGWGDRFCELADAVDVGVDEDDRADPG